MGRKMDEKNKMLKMIVVLSAVLLCLGCGDVEIYYPTYQAAEQDGVFKKGWLPDILPPCASQFHIKTNLDLNESRGNFFLDKQGMEIFVEKLKKRDGKENEFQYISLESIWIFYTDSNGYVRYQMYPQKKILESQFP